MKQWKKPYFVRNRFFKYCRHTEKNVPEIPIYKMITKTARNTSNIVYVKRKDSLFHMNFNFNLPVEIIFGGGSINKLPEIIKKKNYTHGVLVCDAFFRTNGLAQKIIDLSNGYLVDVFSDILPNPTVNSVDECAKVLRAANADFAIALGGGSTMDCAKAACAVCRTTDSIRDYHTGGKVLDPALGIGLIAVPTTAGTGSEVTWVAVLTDPDKKIKAPLGNLMLLPKVALIDYQLTMGIPKAITASTGIDVLSHALEGYWSTGHQPICDATAMAAAKLVFEFLPKTYENGNNEKAREMMSTASLLAGVAFGHPKTTGPHACSFPLTNLYKVPHGEACAFTLDSFTRINADDRLHEMARYCGFQDAYDMADGIQKLKKDLGLRVTLKEIGIAESDIPELSNLSMHPNMLNNPVQMSVESVRELYIRLLK